VVRAPRARLNRARWFSLATAVANALNSAGMRWLSCGSSPSETALINSALTWLIDVLHQVACAVRLNTMVTVSRSQTEAVTPASSKGEPKEFWGADSGVDDS
jgi:hypothetical protein